MPEIVITVRNKIATASVRQIVCDNTDYTVRLDLDADWTAGAKTVLFVLQGVGVLAPGVTTDDVCDMPAIHLSDGVGRQLAVGVQQGSVRTTTAASIWCYPSAESAMLNAIIEDEGVSKTWLEWVNENMALAETNVETAERVLAEAQGAADEAAASAAEAEAARDDARAAQNAAETAQTGAEAAQRTAETAQTGAEAAKTAAETAQTSAEAARDTAITARDTAVTAKNDAETAKTAAQTAKNSAETAKNAAVAAKEAAETAKTAAETARTEAETAQASAIAAKTAAETARTGAESAATSAGNSAQAAEGSASAASTAAETAGTAAGTATAKAGEASDSATAAASSASTASSSASAASGSASGAASSADTAQAWATGGSSGTPSATNNAKYYSEQAAAEAAAAATSAATFETDTTLAVSGKAADAKVTGDAVGELKDANDETQEILYPVLPEKTFNEFTSDSVYHNMGITMVAGSHYRIGLMLQGYSASDLSKITSISTFSSPTSSAVVNTLLEDFGNLKADEFMYIDYTPTANCTHIKIGYKSTYSSETNKSIWKIIDKNTDKVTFSYDVTTDALYDSNEVDYSKHSIWEWSIGSGNNFKWNAGNASYSNSYVIPVENAEKIEIVANNEQPTYYVLLNSATPTLNGAIDTAPGSTGRVTIQAGQTRILNNKNGSIKYLYVLNRSSQSSGGNLHRPRKIVLYTYKSNPYTQIESMQKEIDALKQLVYGLVSVTPATVSKTIDGQTVDVDVIQDIPQNKGVRNFLKRIEYLRNVPWTSVDVIPLNSAYEGGNLAAGNHNGIIYSSAKEKFKYVGLSVSFKTFFTAAHNPYSLLYTENISLANSQSGYGFTYHGTNCAAYYGIVCSVLVAVGMGWDVYWGSREYVYLIRSGKVLRAYNNNAEGVRIGDMLPETGHIAVITNIERDSDGLPTDITLVETWHPHPVAKHYSLAELNQRITSESEKVCHNPYLYEVPAFEEFDAENYAYNDDICTYAGDEAAFYESEPVWINYTKGDYTHMKLYKNNTLIQTLALDADATIHKLDVSSYCAEYGSYKACLTDGTNDSGFTKWIVAETDVTCTNDDGILTVTFSSSNARPVYIELCYIDGTTRGNYVLSDDEIAAGTVTFDPTAQLMEQEEFLFADHTISGNRFDETTYVRVFFDCGYGVVFNPLIDTQLYTE